MQAQYKPVSGNILITVDCTDMKDLLKKLAEIDDVFGEAQCGGCGGKSIRYTHRSAQGYDFYEAVCTTCKAKLQYGQAKEGGKLFPRRKDKEGNYLQNGGWEKFQAGAKPAAPAAQPIEQPDF